MSQIPISFIIPAMSPHLLWTSLHPSHMSFITTFLYPPAPPPNASDVVPASGSKLLHIPPKKTMFFLFIHLKLYFCCEGGSNAHSLLPCPAKKVRPPLLYCVFCLSAILGFSFFFFFFCIRLQRCVSAPRSSQEPNPCTLQQNVTS